jgi:8-amino-7-oxononanoate synthase
MNNAVHEYIRGKLLERTSADNLRTLRVNHGMADFYSNDYLGFARNQALFEAAHKEIKSIAGREGFKPTEPVLAISGSTGSRLLSGNNSYVERLEQQLAEFYEGEDALLFNSGYDANLGILSSIPYKDATVIYDELVHASMHDGMRLGKAGRVAFRHNDLQDLEQKLKETAGLKFVAIEALYSMDGDEAALQGIIALCRRYEAAIIIDEAHSNGIIGSKGQGKARAEGLHKDIFIRVYTFGKAIGAHGAVAVCSRQTKQFLVNYCRPFIFSTALPLHALAAIKAAYDYLPLANAERKQLNDNIELFTGSIKPNPAFTLVAGKSPVQSLVISGNANTKEIAQTIQQQGFDVRPILAPTVPAGKERIRICLHSFNTTEEISGLINAINNL